MKRIDETDNSYGRLKVICLHHMDGEAYWECSCQCGKTTIVAGYRLRTGHTKSCGCFAREQISKKNTIHGMSKTRTFNSWLAMKNRCTQPSQPAYPYYGGRGIIICDRWKEFKNFFEDMGICEAGMTLDRINVNGNYEPSNCRWADKKTQSMNQRSRKRIENFSDEELISEVNRRGLFRLQQQQALVHHRI